MKKTFSLEKSLIKHIHCFDNIKLHINISDNFGKSVSDNSVLKTNVKSNIILRQKYLLIYQIKFKQGGPKVIQVFE